VPDSAVDLADFIIDELIELRRKIQARVRETNVTTEREVMAAAEAAGRVTSVASRHIQELQGVFASLQRQQGASLEQTSSADARLREIAACVDLQQTSAKQAIVQAEKITEVARSVQKLATRASLLSFNARIEAARSGNGSEGFAVIANEMKHLSAAINTANTSIGSLAHDLHAALPGLAEQATEIKRLSNKLSSELSENLSLVRQVAARLNDELSQALSGSDQVLEQIVSASHDVLSHLQFQDTVAQGLGRMDSWLRDAEVQAAERLGATERVAEFPPPMHTELGGHKPVDQHGAGAVSLFEDGGAAPGRSGDVLLFGDD